MEPIVISFADMTFTVTEQGPLGVTTVSLSYATIGSIKRAEQHTSFPSLKEALSFTTDFLLDKDGPSEAFLARFPEE